MIASRLFFAAACISTPHPGSIVLDKNRTNVLGTHLIRCSEGTGFYRDGYCASGPEDRGVHVVCSEVTKAFLDFSKHQGNDLVNPLPEIQFKGLKPGDRWCLCADRWQEANLHHVAPPVILEATHERALSVIRAQDLQSNCPRQ